MKRFISKKKNGIASHSRNVRDVGARVRAGSLSPRKRHPQLSGNGSPFRPEAQKAAESRASDAQYLNAIRQFEVASRHFRHQQYAKAKDIFEKLATVPYLEIADRARLHCQLCEQKLEPVVASVKRVDHYLLGVAELNTRNFGLAIDHLTKADRSAPNRDYIRYALAAAHALQGNTDLALEHLKAAVRLRPQNSFQARHDEDFQCLAQHPVFKSLVRGEGIPSVSAAT